MWILLACLKNYVHLSGRNNCNEYMELFVAQTHLKEGKVLFTRVGNEPTTLGVLACLFPVNKEMKYCMKTEIIFTVCMKNVFG